MLDLLRNLTKIENHVVNSTEEFFNRDGYICSTVHVLKQSKRINN